MPTAGVIALFVVGLIIGFVGGNFFRKIVIERARASIREEAEKIIEEARAERERIKKEALLEAKEEIYQEQRQREKEYKQQRAELLRLESKLQGRESAVERKLEALEKRERQLADKERNIETRLREVQRKESEVTKLEEQIQKQLEVISGLTAEEAKKLLLERLENEVRQEAAAIIRRVEMETREIANKKARQIITLAIQKCATETVTETTVSFVPLPNEEMKGRIIGREGRNIRALEAATGCNIIVDDTPEAVVLSCFDPLRREVAKRTLEKLISDGRIHPARIEELVAKTQQEVEALKREIGEQVTFDLGIFEVHPELIKLLGSLKFRTSYGQNVLSHSIEVAHLASVMAEELGADVLTARRAGLLHDIGKAVSYDMQGTHALIGAELAKKYNESPAVVHAIASHHGEEEFRTLVAVLVQAADTISAARPGARRETLESYIKRLSKLEEIASSFDGVAKSYAIQAGREVRIIVQPDKLNDNECAKLAYDISKRFENELEYPGQIKVVVLRETRATEYAR